MTTDLRHVYAQKALVQLPRLIGNQDRNPYSPTYGCFHRDYWLDKTSDFPDAVRQFAAQALAIAYAHPMPGNIYHGQPKIAEWAIAGLDYWARLQHSDGSFDEFYPYERGWVGPTAFTTFTSVETYHLLHTAMPDDVARRVRHAIRQAAYFIMAGESEEDHLANHHAMACLAVWKAYELLEEPALKEGYDKLWQGFLAYHHPEGWSREYDGVDPGYLSATVSFLSKIYQSNPDPAILTVLRQSVEFCSYFVYPNGFYAGSMGSRNTLHFYSHGFEIMANTIPLAAAIAEKMLQALEQNKLVPPEIISDRYVVYRVPEFLQSYLDYTPRPETLPHLPYEREPFSLYFPGARIFAATRPDEYVLANLAKGGVVKIFNRHTGQLLLNDCGFIGQLEDGPVVTSQWIDPDYICKANDHGFQVRGQLHAVPSHKLFTLTKNIIFRSVLLALGWNPTFSHMLKGNIRKVLMLGRRPVGVRFSRRLQMEQDRITITSQLESDQTAHVTALSLGDEFFVRYVPQSRYFQAQELDVQGYPFAPSYLQALNQGHTLVIQQHITADGRTQEGTTMASEPAVSVSTSSDIAPLPFGVYDIDYYLGRQRKPQLIYRLRRRTDEVESALRRYGDGRMQVIVDVGTADGLMLDNLQQRMGNVTFLGFDLSMALLRANSQSDIFKSQSDALCMPIRTGSADAIIATAIIEHVPDPTAMMRECARMLRPGGILVITTPDPTMEKISSAIGLLKEAGHQETLNLTQLGDIAERAGLSVMEARKFMFSPVGFPAEEAIEKAMRATRLDLVMANQLLVVKKV